MADSSRMRRLALVLTLLSSGACAGARDAGRASAGAEEEGGPRSITLSLLATNDVHGQLERLSYFSGYVDIVRRRRKGNGGVVLVDAGDAFQGTIESNLNEGAAVVSLFNALGYQAFALGNHEFDFGPAGVAAAPVGSTGPADDPRGALKRRAEEARFAVLAANLTATDGSPHGLPRVTPSTLTVVSGIRVGIVGLLTGEAAEVIKRPNFDGLVTAPLAPAAIRESLELRRRGAEVLVLVAHVGGKCTEARDPRDLSSCDPDSELFQLVSALPPGLVDAVVGGHRNAGVAHFVAEIPVVHTPSHLGSFSRVDLAVDARTRRVTGRTLHPARELCSVPVEDGCEPGSYEGEPVRPDPHAASVAAGALAAARTVKERRLGVTVSASFLPSKRGEGALGNLFADLMREAIPGAQVAFGNAGSIRHSLPAGELTFGALFRVMPFDNRIARLRITGRELRALVAASLSGPDHGLLAISGLRASARCEGGSVTVTLLTPSGGAVADDDTLHVVTNDYLAMGGDGLVKAATIPRDRIDVDLGVNVLDALEQGLRRRGKVSPGDRSLFDPENPRIVTPSPVPVRCAAHP